MSSNISPCACGGSGELYCLPTGPRSIEAYHVECRECGDAARKVTKQDKAIAIWNRRQECRTKLELAPSIKEKTDE